MYVKSLDDGTYAVTEDEVKLIEREKRKHYHNHRPPPSVTKGDNFTKVKYPVIILAGVGLFVLIASTSISSGWLWLLGILSTIALAIVTLIWGLELGEKRHKSARFGVVLVVAMMGMFMLAPSIHQWAESNRIESSKVAQISDLSLSVDSEGVYVHGSISNITNKIRDYNITLERWKPAEEWSRGDLRNEIYKRGGEDYTKEKYLQTSGSITVSAVQPDEKRSWKCLLSEQTVFDGSARELRIVVNGGWYWVFR